MIRPLAQGAVLVAAMVLGGGLVSDMGGCTAEDRKALVPAVEKLACIVIRAIAHDGTIDEVCATADELAPYVLDIVDGRKSGRVPQELVSTTSANYALSLPPPKKRTPRRHCVRWEPVASSSDAGLDGADADADASGVARSDSGTVGPDR